MVGKRKNPADNIYPPRVYRGKSKFEFHPVTGGLVQLCPLDSPVSLIWAKYEAALKNLQEKTNLSGLIDQFFESADYTRLGAETRKDYKKYSKKIIPVFGKMDPDAVKPQHIRNYMDNRGVAAPVQANREKVFLSRVYRWAYERGMVAGNPCKAVRQFKEEERERYITDEEYNALFGVAPTVIQVAMELAYLCLARLGDVLALQKSQLLPEGIFIKQGKTSAKQIKAWSDRSSQSSNWRSLYRLKMACRVFTFFISIMVDDIPATVLTVAGHRLKKMRRSSTLTCYLISPFTT